MQGFASINFKALKNRLGIKTYEIVSKVLKLKDKVSVYPARKEGYTVSLNTGDGKKINLVSKWDPVKEAEDVVRRYENQLKAAKLVIVIGAAGGHLIKELYKKTPNFTEFVIFDGDFEVLASMFYATNLVEFIKNRNFKINASRDVEFLLKDINDVLKQEYLAINYLVIRAPYTYFYEKEFYDELEKKVNEYILNTMVNYMTMLNIQRVTFYHFFDNFEFLAKNKGIEQLKNKFSDRPALVVMAGPTLDDNIEQVKKLQGKALIIAVGTAALSLYLNGIEPDIMVAADVFRNSINAGYMLQYLKNSYFFGSALLNKEWLSIVDKDKSFFFNPNNKIVSWLERFKNTDFGLIHVAGTVGTAAISTAIFLGARPIYLVGQDLIVYPGKSHAAGTYYDFVKYSNLEELITVDTSIYMDEKKFEKKHIKLKTNEGKEVYTTQVLLSYSFLINRMFSQLKELNLMFKTSPYSIVDYQYKDLEEVVKELKDLENIDFKGKIKEILDNFKLELNIDAMLKEIDLVVEDLEGLEERTTKMIDRAGILYAKSLETMLEEKREIKDEIYELERDINEKYISLKTVESSVALHKLWFEKKKYEILKAIDEGKLTDRDKLDEEIGKVYAQYFALIRQEARVLKQAFEGLREKLLKMKTEE